VTYFFGKQTTGGPATAPTRFYPVIQSHQEMCEVCDRIDDRERMHLVTLDESGDGIYVCDKAHAA
jgi:hypothetical protein